MIVRCPECSTGFKLPADRVGPRGAKVRCTKCDHVFRVRIVDDEPEIFYKPGEEPDQSKASFSDFGNKTAFGGPHSFASEDGDDSEVRETGGHTAIGRPGDLKNLRSTPRKPLASVPSEEDEEKNDDNTAALPMAAGIINKRTIKKSNDDDQPSPPKTPSSGEDEDFAGPGRAHEISEPDDATAIGKPVEDSYNPKATSFGLPAVGGDDPFADEPDDDETNDGTSRTSFGFPAESLNDAPEKGFGEADDDDEKDGEDTADEDDDIRATAFGRPAFGEDESDAEEDEPQFGENPKGTLFGLPAVGGDDEDAPDAPKDQAVDGRGDGRADDGTAQKATDDEGLDLFEDEPEEPAQELDDDPFAGAFEDKIDESPAASVDPSLQEDDPFGFDDEDEDGDFDAAFAPDDSFDPNAGIDVPDSTEDQGADEDDDYDDSFFAGGGGGSDFGDANELVDPSFGSDGPTFDPDAGEPATESRGAGANPGEIEFDAGPAEGVDLVMETSPPPAAERERERSGAKRAKSDTKSSEKSKRSKKGTSTGAGRRVAASGPDAASGLQKFMNFLLIVMIVVTAFIGLVLYRTGGVIDFARFDHMLAIVIDGESFEPRPEWGIVKRTADDVEPLDSTNVFAFETSAKDTEAFVVRGEIENQGTTGFGSVKVRVSLIGPDGSLLDDKTVSGGTKIDANKLEELGADAFEDAVERQMSNVDPGKSIPFVAVFEEMPVNSMDELDILVEVTEKTEIPTEAK